MDKVLSDKIRIASLLCTFMVVVRHSRNLQAFWGTESVDNVCAFVEDGCSILTEIAVPFFFLISGFFFFRYSYYSKGVYVSMAKKKGKSLFLPFLVWNLVGFVIILLVGESLKDNPLDEKQTLLDYALGFLLSDYYGPLWYVRNLILMMAVVPLYGWIFNMNRSWIYILVLIPLLIWWSPVDCAWWSSEGWFFFLSGGVLWRYQKVLSVKFPVAILMAMVCIWLMMCFVRWEWSVWMNKITTLWGIITFWYLLDFVQKKLSKFLFPLCPYVFFIYVTHYWFVKGLKIIVASFYLRDMAVALLSYFLLPIIVFVVLLYLGKLWNFLNSKSLKIVTGNRL